MEKTFELLDGLTLNELEEINQLLGETNRINLNDLDIFYNFSCLNAVGSTGILDRNCLENFFGILNSQESRDVNKLDYKQIRDAHTRYINSLNKDYVRRLQKVANTDSFRKLHNFLVRLRTDFTQDIFDYCNARDDIIKRANNWQEELNALRKKNVSGINQDSLSKLDKICSLYDNQGVHVFRMVEMYNNLDHRSYALTA